MCLYNVLNCSVLSSRSFAYQVQQQALHLSQHAPNSPAVDHPPPLNKSGAQSSGDICNSLSPPTEPAALSHWLTAAACEAKMLQMLLNQCDARDQQQQQHLLQAVVGASKIVSQDCQRIFFIARTACAEACSTVMKSTCPAATCSV